MLIAQKLRKENIAEYILYMWQVEDLIRANGWDIDQIEQNIISKYEQPEDKQLEIREWYESLIEMMLIEGVKEQGHLAINNNTIIQITDLHKQLLNSSKHAKYVGVYMQALPFIVELRAKSGEGEEVSELETCLSALYGLLLMRMQGKEISGETQAAISVISNLLRLLSKKFWMEQDEKLEL